MQRTFNRTSAFVVSLTFAPISLLSLLFTFFINDARAQDSVNIKPFINYSHTYPYNSKRVKQMAIANVAGYSAAMAGLYAAWYKDYPQSKFHTFNDVDEWMQMDKIGHTFSAYAESKASMELWRRTGISRKKIIWLGGMSGAAYQTVIEILDGYSAQWGWSWADIGANFLGSGFLVAQELLWNEQCIQLKWSFHKKKYVDPELQQRGNVIFGNSAMERFLKDYNGQTYWLSTGLKTWLPSSNIPDWLQLSIGTGVEGVWGARENVATDKNGNVIFSRPDVQRVRQWYLAPDLDLTKIKTRKKGIRMALNMLNIIKFPAPALEYSKGKFKFRPIYF